MIAHCRWCGRELVPVKYQPALDQSRRAGVDGDVCERCDEAWCGFARQALGAMDVGYPYAKRDENDQSAQVRMTLWASSWADAMMAHRKRRIVEEEKT